ncbi:MAG: dihydroxyacetone kinase subunit DhaK [Rubrobacter sp.]|nr:dihydroxyacetone kinase subunit DhaK [Rubrobacter sp.]
MKKVLNEPGRAVEEMLRGMELAHGGEGGLIRRLSGQTVAVRSDAPVRGKVALVSGGGSGHEPAHAGYVGPGMLDAACAGEVFTSPSPEPILEATKAVDGGAGVFYVVKNYTGDVLNFEMAGELAQAEGIETDYVIVNDDVAEIKSLAARVGDNVRSMGMALTSCVPPERGEPIFDIADDEMEIGIGIHGEPGTERKQIEPADRVVGTLLERVLGDSVDFSGSEVAVMVNGMGGTPLMELYVAYARVHDALREAGVTVYGTPYVGEYMTSLEMAGFSVTLLRLDEEMKRYLTAPCSVAAGRPF